MTPTAKRRRVAGHAVPPEAPLWNDLEDETGPQDIHDPLTAFHDLPAIDIVNALSVGDNFHASKRSKPDPPQAGWPAID
jgi:hypothetical protein